MLNLAGALLVVVLFAALLHVLGLVERTKEVITIGGQAAETLRDTSLPDADKERHMQRNSLQMFRLLAILVAGTAVALTAPLVLIWIAELAGIVSLEAVLQLFLQWDFVAAATILGIAAYLASVKWLRRNS